MPIKMIVGGYQYLSRELRALVKTFHHISTRYSRPRPWTIRMKKLGNTLRAVIRIAGYPAQFKVPVVEPIQLILHSQLLVSKHV